MALVSRALNPDRWYALDVFRGLTIAAMILVNSPGGARAYRPLEHAAWNGWTPTDLIYPSFVFILGVALAYSLAPRVQVTSWKGLSLFDWITPILAVVQYAIKLSVQTNGFTRAPDPAIGGYDLFFAAVFILLLLLPWLEHRAAATGGSPPLRVIHHGFLLFAIGFVWGFDALNPAGFRPLAVLQRLGIVYLFAGLIMLNTRRRGQIAWVVGLLALYWILMKSVPVPGYGAGVLTMEGNLAGFIDRLILGRAHMYTPRPLPYWDPEGILGAVPAIASGLLGALAGGAMREDRPIGEKMRGLCIVGSLLAVAGLGLSPWFPINKNLWSPTYVLFAAGIDFVLLAVCIWFVDFKGAKRIALPFIALGCNSIFIYLFSGMFWHYAANISGGTSDGVPISLKDAAYNRLFASWLNPYNASLAMALSYVALWTIIAAVLYRKRWFVRI